MGRPTLETGGGTPQNQGLSEFKPLAKESRVGWGVKKVERRVLPGAKPQDGDTPFWQEFPDQEVYASGMSNCVGLTSTPKDMQIDEEL
jgi:hypothetical protein